MLAGNVVPGSNAWPLAAMRVAKRRPAAGVERGVSEGVGVVVAVGGSETSLAVDVSCKAREDSKVAALFSVGEGGADGREEACNNPNIPVISAAPTVARAPIKATRVSFFCLPLLIFLDKMNPPFGRSLKPKLPP